MNDLWHMQSAFKEAEKAFDMDEVPVGAIIVDDSDKVLASAHNLKEKNKNPCHHAEVLAIGEATRQLKKWRLESCTLFVTMEPCIMCLGAICESRMARIVFGAYDSKRGALSNGLHPLKSDLFNHRPDLLGGLMHYECSHLLSTFFRGKRAFHKSKKI